MTKEICEISAYSWFYYNEISSEMLIEKLKVETGGRDRCRSWGDRA
jgi:hypothetical protein